MFSNCNKCTISYVNIAHVIMCISHLHIDLCFSLFSITLYVFHLIPHYEVSEGNVCLSACANSFVDWSTFVSVTFHPQ